jgi:flagellar motor switch protein FliG
LAENEIEKPAIALSGTEKASVLLISLGSDKSSSVLQQLTPEEIERLTAEIVMLKRVDQSLRTQVLDECKKALGDQTVAGGAEYARVILEQVVGGAKTKELLTRLTSGGGVGNFRWLRAVPPPQLAQCIKIERPQVVALVLGHLPPEQAAQVLSALPEHAQGEVALRLTAMQPTDPEVVRGIDEILIQRLSTADNAAFTEVGGSEAVVNILNNVDRGTEKTIMEYLSEAARETAEEIKEMMFVFEDILGLDDRSIQVILRDMPQDDLRLALKGSPDNVKEVFFRNMSQRAVETLKEDLDSSGPVKLRDVEAAQGRISSIARALDEAGEISIRDKGEDVVM